MVIPYYTSGVFHKPFSQTTIMHEVEMIASQCSSMKLSQETQWKFSREKFLILLSL